MMENIFKSNSEALVVPVNCVGVMGKGLALAFAKEFPDCLEPYKRACRTKELCPGQVFAWRTGQEMPRYLIHFPTKRDWREASRMEDIQLGMESLATKAVELRLTSIAIPALGCGLGGLQWAPVEGVIRGTMARLAPMIELTLFGPNFRS